MGQIMPERRVQKIVKLTHGHGRFEAEYVENSPSGVVDRLYGLPYRLNVTPYLKKVWKESSSAANVQFLSENQQN